MSQLLMTVIAFFCFSSMALGATLYPLADDNLLTAAVSMSRRDYRNAADFALKAKDGGIRDFMAGMALFRNSDQVKADELLGKAYLSFPLLADYALYYRAHCLADQGRYDESISALSTLIKGFPDFPYGREAQKLMGDYLMASGELIKAEDAYRKFLEKFPSGKDSLEVSYSLAKCTEARGDVSSAAGWYRKLWLEHPTSPVAEKAASEIRRLRDNGIAITPYKPEELFHRAGILYELGSYENALNAYLDVPTEGVTIDFLRKLELMKGKALYRAKRYSSAEKALMGLMTTATDSDFADEAKFWFARTQDKVGKEDEACALYESLAVTSSDLSLAARSLLAAAFVRKYQNRGKESITILKGLINRFPKSSLLQTAYWEIAWQSYVGGDLESAATFFHKLLDESEMREKSLYWYGRTLEASGDKTGADKVFSQLKSEYPLGYYALNLKSVNDKEVKTASFPDSDIADFLPMPAGYDRIKALITIGLHDEARRELSQLRRKDKINGSTRASIARLYAELSDYHRVVGLARKEMLNTMDSANLVEWRMAFPRAFRHAIRNTAKDNGVPESLVSSIILAESNYYQGAVSPVGAIGLMQLMPATAAAIADGGGASISEKLKNPQISINYGIKHLKDLFRLYNGDSIMAVSAYNAGSGNVNRWIKKYGKMEQDQFIENIPFSETRNYVKKVLLGMEIYKRLYGLDQQTSSSDNPNATIPAVMPQKGCGASSEPPATLPPLPSPPS